MKRKRTCSLSLISFKEEDDGDDDDDGDHNIMIEWMTYL